MLKENELINSQETLTLEQRRAFLKLPLGERRRILSQQADNAAIHNEFEQNIAERDAWQGGDIVEY